MKQRNPWEAKSWDDLVSLTTLDVVLKALLAAEKNRLAHKAAYERKATILSRAKAAGITAD